MQAVSFQAMSAPVKTRPVAGESSVKPTFSGVTVYTGADGYIEKLKVCKPNPLIGFWGKLLDLTSLRGRVGHLRNGLLIPGGWDINDGERIKAGSTNMRHNIREMEETMGNPNSHEFSSAVIKFLTNLGDQYYGSGFNPEAAIQALRVLRQSEIVKENNRKISIDFLP